MVNRYDLTDLQIDTYAGITDKKQIEVWSEKVSKHNEELAELKRKQDNAIKICQERRRKLKEAKSKGLTGPEIRAIEKKIESTTKLITYYRNKKNAKVISIYNFENKITGIYLKIYNKINRKKENDARDIKIKQEHIKKITEEKKRKLDRMSKAADSFVNKCLKKNARYVGAKPKYENCFMVEFTADLYVRENASHKREVTNLRNDAYYYRKEGQEYLYREKLREIDKKTHKLVLVGKNDYEKVDWFSAYTSGTYSSEAMIAQLMSLQRHFEYNSSETLFSPMLQELIWTEAKTIVGVFVKEKHLEAYSDADLFARACIDTAFDYDYCQLYDGQIPAGILLWDRNTGFCTNERNKLFYSVPKGLYDMYYSNNCNIEIISSYIEGNITDDGKYIGPEKKKNVKPHKTKESV